MSRFKVLSGKDVCKILFNNGFVQVRQKGSHIITKSSRNKNWNTSIYHQTIRTFKSRFSKLNGHKKNNG